MILRKHLSTHKYGFSGEFKLPNFNVVHRQRIKKGVAASDFKDQCSIQGITAKFIKSRIQVRGILKTNIYNF